MTRVRSRDTANAVRVQGLRELQQGLSRADPQLRRLLGVTNRNVAERLVADPARSRAQTLGGGQIRLARPSVIKAGGTARAATVTLNQTAAVPDAFAQEFGRNQAAGWNRRPGRVRNSSGQFRPWRGNAYEDTWAPGADGAGYAIYPTIRANQQRIQDEYLDTLMDALADAFPERT